MVGRDDLVNAIALNSTVFNGARVVGPAIAGILVARIGEGWCIFVNGASYVAVIAGLLAMRGVPRRPPATGASPLERLREGFAYAARTRPVLALLALLAVVSLAGMPYSVLMPIFADEILGGGPRTLGMLMGASGVGALLGAFALALRRSTRGLGTFVAVVAAGFGLTLVAFSQSRSFWLSAALLVPAGFCLMSQMSSSNTLIQALTPDALRGRVMSVYAMVFMGGAPLGALAAGTLASRFGAPATVAAGGVACLVAALLFARRVPTLRAEARERIEALAATGALPEEPA
jgi:predicted MFS family arabinose efflux permease